MKSLNRLKRDAEQVSNAKQASIKYDEDYREHVELRTEGNAPLEELDRICSEHDAVMKPDGKNPFGEHVYLFR